MGPVDKDKVLVVDDEAGVRAVLSKSLRINGFEVIEAPDGHQALELFRKERLSAVLLDMRMPHMDGIETMKEMKRVDGAVPVIMVTAIDDISTVVDTVKLGAYDFIVKPPDFEKLALTVRRAADKCRMDRNTGGPGMDAGMFFENFIERELKDVVRRAVLLWGDDILKSERIKSFAGDGHFPPMASMKDVEKMAIRRALDLTKGKRTKAASLLEIDYKTLVRKMKEYNIQ